MDDGTGAESATVLAVPISIFRKLFAVILLLAVFFGLSVLNVWETDNARLAGEMQTWINPMTGKSTHLSKTWMAGDLTSTEENVYHFRSDFLLSEGVLGIEEVGFYFSDNDTYAAALQDSLSDAFNFYTGWSNVVVGNKASKRAFATSREDPNVDVQITVAIQGTYAWRTLVFSRGRKASEMPFTESFVRGMFETMKD